MFAFHNFPDHCVAAFPICHNLFKKTAINFKHLKPYKLLTSFLLVLLGFRWPPQTVYKNRP